jgi:hypothetical protein
VAAVGGRGRAAGPPPAVAALPMPSQLDEAEAQGEPAAAGVIFGCTNSTYEAGHAGGRATRPV